MPTPGVNVLQNPDWTELTSYGAPLYWVTDATWDPLLAWGCGGDELFEALATNGGLTVLGPNSLQVDWARSTQLDPSAGRYAGLLYAGEGFDGVPGDSWRIQFDAVRSTYIFGGGFFLSTIIGPTTDLFVRVGIIVPDGDSWTSYTMDLPIYASARTNGSVVNYDETFEIPSDWPEGIYQFAVVTSGDPTLPFNTVYTYGLRQTFSNFSLEYVSSGAGSPGPAGVASPYVNWPVPRWAPGSPVCDPPDCSGTVEWDYWDFRLPLTDAVAVLVPPPHVTVFGPTTEGVNTTVFYDGLYNPDPNWTAEEQGPTDLDKLIDCAGDYCVFLALFYTAVPWREYQASPVGGGQWIAVREFKPMLCHPSSLGGRVNGRGQHSVPWGKPVPVPEDDDALFCFSGCQDIPPGPPAPQPVYLTHEVAPGDANIPAGGTGALNLRAIRAGAGDGSSAGTGSGGIHLGGVKGQP